MNSNPPARTYLPTKRVRERTPEVRHPRTWRHGRGSEARLSGAYKLAERDRPRLLVDPDQSAHEVVAGPVLRLVLVDRPPRGSPARRAAAPPVQARPAPYEGARAPAAPPARRRGSPPRRDHRLPPDRRTALRDDGGGTDARERDADGPLRVQLVVDYERAREAGASRSPPHERHAGLSSFNRRRTARPGSSMVGEEDRRDRRHPGLREARDDVRAVEVEGGRVKRLDGRRSGARPPRPRPPAPAPARARSTLGDAPDKPRAGSSSLRAAAAAFPAASSMLRGNEEKREVGVRTSEAGGGPARGFRARPPRQRASARARRQRAWSRSPSSFPESMPGLVRCHSLGRADSFGYRPSRGDDPIDRVRTAPPGPRLVGVRRAQGARHRPPPLYLTSPIGAQRGGRPPSRRRREHVHRLHRRRRLPERRPLPPAGGRSSAGAARALRAHRLHDRPVRALRRARRG